MLNRAAQFFHAVNVCVFLASGLGLLFFTERMVPGVTASAKASVRGYGGISLVYGYLYGHLGHMNHGAYCLTMVLHFILMTIYGLELMDQKRLDGSYEPSLYVPCLYHYIAFFGMLTLLVTVGLGSEKAKVKV